MGFDDQLKRVFDAALAELSALSTAERDAARKEGLDRGRTLGWEDGLEQGRFEGRQAAEEEGRAALDAADAASRAERASEQAATGRLVAGIRAMDRARTLTETLDTLVVCAARETARAGVLLVRSGYLRPFRFVGLNLIEQAVAIDESDLIASAIGSGTAVTTEAGGSPAPPRFAGLDAGHVCLVVPVTLAGDVVAVLYADQQGAEAGASPSAWPDALEILTRHASKCLEALTAVKAARALTGMAADEGSRASAADGAEDADMSARRYARLLVSEIKLYHEPAVVAGQRDRDLASRLGGEIARARVLYEQRVPAAVRQRADYFRDELVRTLANGDATLLQLT